MRVVWAVCGVFCLCFGAVGVLLPLLPTVPFMLLAAVCFARSSPQLHAWLIHHPVFGPPVVDWQRHGAIGRPAKRLATLSIVCVLGLSVAMGVRWTLLAVQAAVLAGVLIFIWSRPETPKTG